MLNRYFKIGSLKIGKGNSYVFSSLVDFSSGGTREQENEYAGDDGSMFDEIYMTPKEFSIDGNIIAKNYEELVTLKRNLLHECKFKKLFTVEYYNGINSFFAECLLNGGVEFDNEIITKNKCFLAFNISLRNPSYYWLSEKIIENIYEEVPQLTNTSVLPCVFSARNDTKIINIIGDDKVSPIIKLICQDEVAVPDDVTISNNTSNKTFVLTHSMAKDEIITIDCENMTINSDVSGDLINSVDRIDNFFDLEQGENELQIVSAGIIGLVEYQEKYVGV